jgi:hypothetical protein
MCCGIQDKKGRQLAELEDEPCKTLMTEVKNKFKVNIPELIKEVGRRCKQRGLRINKCSNIKKQAIKDQLYSMLPLNPLDIQWLIAEEACFL